MTRYLCSLPNVKGEGRMFELYSDDPGKIDAFTKQHDVPGRAVYACVNPLKPGARQRRIETVARIERLPFDIDFKDLKENAEQIDAKLLQLPCEPTAVNDSGGGRHVIYELKEPIDAEEDPETFARAGVLMKSMAMALSADPAPTHPAALLRVAGTHNSKRGSSVLVRELWGSGKPVDITDLEALVDLLPESGIFTRKSRTNGAGHAPAVATDGRPDRRVCAPRGDALRGAGEASIQDPVAGHGVDAARGRGLRGDRHHRVRGHPGGCRRRPARGPVELGEGAELHRAHVLGFHRQEPRAAGLSAVAAA